MPHFPSTTRAAIAATASILLWAAPAAADPVALASTPGLVFVANEYGTDYYRGPCLIESADGVLLDEECTIGLSEVAFLIGGPGDDPRLPESAVAAYAHLEGSDWSVYWQEASIYDVRFEGPCLTSDSLRFCIGGDVPPAVLTAPVEFPAISELPSGMKGLEGWWAPKKAECGPEVDQSHVAIGRSSFGDAGLAFGVGTVKVSMWHGSCEFASLAGMDGEYAGRALCIWEGRPVQGEAELYFTGRDEAHLYLPGAPLRGTRLERCETPG